jgi:predicted DNA-binding transcriptional regulator YafY
MIEIRNAVHAWRTLADTMRRRSVITISYRTEGGRQIVRTIEPYELTKRNGNLLVKVMDHPTEDRPEAAIRSYRLDRISFVTEHQGIKYLFEVPAAKSAQTPVVRPDAEILAELDAYDTLAAFWQGEATRTARNLLAAKGGPRS